MDYDFTRYLSAKKTVDDRALYMPAWQRMARELQMIQSIRPVEILEVGGGIGTMFERMREWGVLSSGKYMLVDAMEENIQQAACRVQNLSDPGVKLELRCQDVRDFTQIEAIASWDLVCAHAFLDLFDVDALLPELVRQVKPGGLLYLTINFDGETIFQPVWDELLEERIMNRYHRSMDEREPPGDSRSGRHLFQALAHNQMEILEAGSSDWVVYPRDRKYPGDEAFFLHFIVHFFEETLDGSMAGAVEWIERRHQQIERGELVFIAHQLDFLVRKPF